MRIFITGAASPLGQALTRILVGEGHAVAGQIRRSTGIAVLRGLGAEPVIEDLLRPASLIGVMEGCDLVFHLAHFFDFWAADSSTYLSVNIRGTEAVMTSALVADVHRVVFCSSALAGGDDCRGARTGARARTGSRDGRGRPPATTARAGTTGTPPVPPPPPPSRAPCRPPRRSRSATSPRGWKSWSRVHRSCSRRKIRGGPAGSSPNVWPGGGASLRGPRSAGSG